jgi:hypothetical protein
MEVRQGRLGGKVDKEEHPKSIKTHEDLIIYQKAFDAAMTIFEVSCTVSHRRKIFSD